MTVRFFLLLTLCISAISIVVTDLKFSLKQLYVHVAI